MKKLIFLATMVLAVTVGTAYAYHGSGAWATDECLYVPNNGVTAFCSSSTPSGEIPAMIGTMRPSSYYEVTSAGGFRGEDELYNGITVFTHGLVTKELASFPGEGSISWSSYEAVSAGGLREGAWGKKLFNGITDFGGHTFETYNAGM